ncbi:MAG: TetR/AcrR family transcriptional regulator [Herbinix sp.]|jgi:AcrR family transcriptional regulator|nr:TetR/AcrR family transcriptional regulator [Herbinix sp.]
MKTEKIDRRVKLTILILQQALIELMQNNHISKISVKMLCELADINRSTFYAHYQDQYDLLEYTCKEVIENIKKHLDKQHYNPIKPISFQTLNRILEYVKENADLFKAILSDNCDLDIQRRIMNVFMTYHPYSGIDDRTKEYLSAFGLAGCVSMLQIWLKDGMPETTTRMAEIILQAIDNGITSFDNI